MAYDARNGDLLWKRENPECNYGAMPYADELWMLQRTEQRGSNVYVRVLDPRTGAVKREFPAKGIVNNKCYPTKGAADYLLYSNSWTLERKSGQPLSQDTVRSPCRLGQMPANGMTYLPHHCDCQVTLRGMLAMSRAGTRKWLSAATTNESPGLSPRVPRQRRRRRKGRTTGPCWGHAPVETARPPCPPDRPALVATTWPLAWWPPTAG